MDRQEIEQKEGIAKRCPERITEALRQTNLIIIDDPIETTIEVSSKLFDKLYSGQRFGKPGIFFVVQTRIKIDMDGNILDIEVINE